MSKGLKIMQLSFEDIRENLEISLKRVLRKYALGLPWRNEMLSSSLKQRSQIKRSATGKCLHVNVQWTE